MAGTVAKKYTFLLYYYYAIYIIYIIYIVYIVYMSYLFVVGKRGSKRYNL